MRRGWLSRLGPWIGIGTSPAALMMGGGVGEGLRGGELAAALLVGVALLTGLAAGQGLLGQRTGLTLAQITAGPLGARGSRRTASVAMLAMMLGWFGVNVGVAGVAVARLAGIPDPAGIALFAAAMLGVVAFGLSALSWSALVAGVAATALAAYGMHLVFTDRAVTLTGGEAGSQPIGFLSGVALVLGYGAAFSLRTPDFTHDLRRGREVLLCALVGMAVPTALFGFAGAALYAATGNWDLADVLHDLGSSQIAYLFVALGFTGSVLTNIWSGALSLCDAVPAVPRPAALVGVAAAGAVLAAVGFADLMQSWLTVMALAAPGLVAVCAIHVVRRDTVPPGWRTSGLAAWGGGFGCGLALHVAGSAMALPAAAIVPTVTYWLLRSAGRDRTGNASGGLR
ncbi:MAG: cytosine permease [Thermoleophilia bacterium]